MDRKLINVFVVLYAIMAQFIIMTVQTTFIGFSTSLIWYWIITFMAFLMITGIAMYSLAHND